MSVFAIRSAGKRSLRCPGCTLRSRFDFGFPTVGVAPNGWTDGGVDDLFAAVFRRAAHAAKRLSNSASKRPECSNRSSPVRPFRQIPKSDRWQLRRVGEKGERLLPAIGRARLNDSQPESGTCDLRSDQFVKRSIPAKYIESSNVPNSPSFPSTIEHRINALTGHYRKMNFHGHHWRVPPVRLASPDLPTYGTVS